MPRPQEYAIRICDQCIRLEGEQCHEPACVFCLWPMADVSKTLDALCILPIIDGERFDLSASFRVRMKKRGKR